MTDVSPCWKKPSAIVKIRKKRKADVLQKTRNNPSNIKGLKVKTLGPTKRRNPFGCPPGKKVQSNCILLSDEQSEPSEEPQGLLSLLHDNFQNQTSSQIIRPINMKELDIMEKETSPTKSLQGQKHSEPSEEILQGELKFPIDWSLKTRVRFVSAKPFNWCTNLRSTEETEGMTAFVKGHQALIADKIQSLNGIPGAKQEFFRHCHVWIHPNFSWMKMFPRILSDAKIGKPSPIMDSEDIQCAILSEWTSSFSSVFDTLRSGACPYFYMCSHQFTVMFRRGDIARRSQVNAVITPTSRGFREALKKEDIEFLMPFVKKKSMEEKTDVKDSLHMEREHSALTREDACTPGEMGAEEPQDVLGGNVGDDYEEILETDEGASSWLQSIGLDSNRFRSLDPNKVKLQRESFREIDHRPESTCVVEGGDTQALFNYLLNCRSCVAPTGTQAGVPPTILAPTPFHGATLKPLKAKSGMVRQVGDIPSYSLEVTGPVLPSTISGLSHLFHKTQDSFTSVYNVHEPSTPFNAVPGEENYEVLDTLTQSQENQSVDMNSKHLGMCAIRELVYKNGSYTWSC